MTKLDKYLLPPLLLVPILFGIFSYISDSNRDTDNATLASAIQFAESEYPPRFTGDETDEELRNNPYINHIRTALNGFIDGSNTGEEDVVALGKYDDGCGLREEDKTYYQSKFVLYDVGDNPYGGVQADIVFVDKPDTIFLAWIYQLEGDNKYSMRVFCKVGPPDESKGDFTKLMKYIIKKGDVKFLY